jgi:hypothetical protein
MKAILPLLLLVLSISFSVHAQTLEFKPAAEARFDQSTALLKTILKDYRIFNYVATDTGFTTSMRRISLKIPGMARLEFSVAANQQFIPQVIYTSGKRRSLEHPPLLFIGTSPGKKDQVNLTIGNAFLMGTFSYLDKVYFIEPLRNLVPGAPREQVVIYSENDIIQKAGNCYATNSTASQRNSSIQKLQKLSAAPSERIVDLALAIDNTTFKNHNSNLEETVNYVTTVINLASGLYRYSFNDSLRFRISEMIVFDGSTTDTYFEANTQNILNNLNRFSPWATTGFKKPFDLAGLWYYSRSAGDTIGLANFGTCNSRGNHVIREYGSTIAFMRTLVAHEMGHNFTAQHDAAGSSSIMAPAISGATEWSEQSKLQINYMLSTDETNCIMPPEIVIGSNASLAICKGDTVRFNATVQRPIGANPTYRWKINSQPVGGNDSQYSTASLLNGDTISCDLVSEISGQLYTYWSRQYVLDVMDTAAPQLYTNTSTSFCSSDSIFLLTAGTNNFQWFKDGNIIDSGKSNILVVKTAGTYSVRTLNKGCLSRESQKVTTTVKLSPSRPIITLKDNVLFSSAFSGNQWYLNDTLIAGANGGEYRPLANGKYSVKVTEGGCSSAMSEAFAFVTTSIPGSPYGKALVISPNPVHGGHLTIQYENNNDKMQVKVIDVYGRQVGGIGEFKDRLRLDMTGISKGVYFLLIINQRTGEEVKRNFILL